MRPSRERLQLAVQRNVILKGYRREVDYITELPQQFPVRASKQRGRMAGPR